MSTDSGLDAATSDDADPAAPAPTAAPRGRGRVAVIASVLALAVVALIVGVVLSSGGSEPQTKVIEIPQGTAERIRTGDQVGLLPPVLELSVGDRLIIRNHDDTIHYAGPYTIRPGEVFDITYTRPGIYPGPCSFNNTGETSVVVS